jgi:hypothetical protein
MQAQMALLLMHFEINIHTHVCTHAVEFFSFYDYEYLNSQCDDQYRDMNC